MNAVKSEAAQKEPFCEQLHGLQDWLQDGTINYREWDCGVVTIFTAPHHLGKEFSLVNGVLTKNTLGNLGKCRFGLSPFNNAYEFAEILSALNTTQCLTASTPHGVAAVGRIVRKDQIRENPLAISRGKDHFGLQRGQRSFLTIDYDPAPGCVALDKGELWDIIRAVIPGVESVGVVYHSSSSSWIYRSGELLQGLRGQRFYLFVRDAGDIDRAMGVLQKRLWLAGHGRVLVSKGGGMLLRTPADASLSDQAKLDYAAGAVLRDGLEQRRPAPEVLSPSGWLDTAEALPELTRAEQSRYDKLIATAKQAALPEAQAAKDVWTTEHVRACTSKALARGDDHVKAEVRARESASAALSGFLRGDFEIQLDDGVLVTVGEILDDREKYHHRLTLDPIEPEYRNRKVVGILYLYKGVPVLSSRAHGGRTFKLMRQPDAVTLSTGRSAQTAIEYVSRLSESGDIFSKGGAPVRVLDGVRSIANVTAMALEIGVRFATFRVNAKGESVPADTPENILRMVVEASKTGLKPLRSYVTHPFVTESETVVSPGYHEATGTYAEFDPSDYSGLSSSPSRADVVNALKDIWAPFSKFAFASKQDRAACLSAVLCVVCRPGLDLAPGVLTDAPLAGSGKTLLACTIGALSEGKEPSINVFALGEADIELKKRLISSLLGGSDIFIYDNVMGTFNSPTLAGCLTSGRLKDRILGGSIEYEGPGPRHIFVTSNNASLGVDLSVRFLRVRLNHNVANPSTLRFGFHPVERMKVERVSVLRGCLTVMRAFQSAGSPHHGDGGYRMPGWDRLVRSAVLWLDREGFVAESGVCRGGEGEFDPAEGMLSSTVDAVSDGEVKAEWLARLFDAMESFRKASGKNLPAAFTVSQIFKLTDSYRERDLYEATIDALNGKPLVKGALRSLLKFSVDQIIGPYSLKKDKDKAGTTLYFVHKSA